MEGKREEGRGDVSTVARYVVVLASAFSFSSLFPQGPALWLTPFTRPSSLVSGVRASLVRADAQRVAAPRSFEAIATSSSEIRLYWLTAEGATGYRLQRDGQAIATLPAAAQEYADSGLSPNSTYRYTVQAIAETGESPVREYVERTFASLPSKGSGRPKLFPHTGATPSATYDVVVVQASSGGVAAAIEAARRGLKVALLEPTTRVGGMPVNGLSATDLRRAEHAGGFFVRFRDRVRDLYAREGITATGQNYEPRVAHQAMKTLLYDQPNVTLFRRVRLARVHAVTANLDGSRRRIESIEVEELGADGQPTGTRAVFQARVFIDATDCGDLAAGAGASFRLGREKRTPREPHNGVIYYDRAHDKILPGSTGKGDRRIQAYAYLLTVKDYGPSADKTIPQPPGFRKEDFLHTPAWKESWAVTSGRMPGGKLELNQHPEGGDLQAVNYGYPTGGYRERTRIDRLYRDRVLSYLYYIQTEQGQKQIGLPDDEYRDTGGFPPLLYVREGRRIVGEQMPDESDIRDARQRVRPESVGIGDYPMDSHAVRPKTDWSTPDMGEGEWWLYQYTPWHPLPLGILIPRGLDNLFVTTAVSSTHVSFGTYRMEPVRMAFGQAAGTAASLCLRFGLTAHEVPVRQVQEEMLPHPANPNGDPNAVLYYLTDVKPNSKHYRAIQYLASRGFLFSEEALKPEAPTTRAELAHCLSVLADRAAPPPQVLTRRRVGGVTETTVRRAYYPYMGASADREAVLALQQAPDRNAIVTRAEVAHWMVRVLPSLQQEASQAGPTAPMAGHYTDITDATVRADVEALYANQIDSRSWDGWKAYAPDGRLLFQPDAPLSHADLFATLYLAQIGLGPLFYDNPVDGRDGRETPPALFETVIEKK
jgi:hypothetical protein